MAFIKDLNYYLAVVEHVQNGDKTGKCYEKI